MKLTSHARGTTQPVVLTPHTSGTSHAADTDAVFKFCRTLVVHSTLLALTSFLSSAPHWWYIPRCWHWRRFQVLPYTSGTSHVAGTDAAVKFCPTLALHPTLLALTSFLSSAPHWLYIPRWWYWRRQPVLHGFTGALWYECKILNVKLVVECCNECSWLGWKDNCKILNVSCTFSICAFKWK